MEINQEKNKFAGSFIDLSPTSFLVDHIERSFWWLLGSGNYFGATTRVRSNQRNFKNRKFAGVQLLFYSFEKQKKWVLEHGDLDKN